MKWTPEKTAELRRRYPDEDNARLALEFGCSRKALAYRASCMGLRKSAAATEARYASMGRRRVIHPGGDRREIASGTLIVHGRITTHLSNVSAMREG